MISTRLRTALPALTLAGLLGLATPAQAQQYPEQPISIVVPYSPGGGVDIITRLVTPGMSDTLSQQLIVENRPGGGTNIGMAYVARAKPDGYTLYTASNTITANKALYSKLTFDPTTDFTPVGKIGEAPLVVVVKSDRAFQTLPDLVQYGKANPGKLTFGTAGMGSSGHLASELLMRKADFQALHVPYKGGSSAVTDLLGGRIDFMAINPLEVVSHIKSGSLRALAVLNKQGTPLLPDLATAEQQGLQGVEATVWWGIVVPAGTPGNVVTKLNSALNASLAQAQVQEKLASIGAAAQPGTPDAFAEFLKAETATMTDVITAAGIKAD